MLFERDLMRFSVDFAISQQRPLHTYSKAQQIAATIISNNNNNNEISIYI